MEFIIIIIFFFLPPVLACNLCLSIILSRLYGTWQPITRVLGPNKWVYWTNELQKYHTTKCNTHFRIFFCSQLVILGRWLLTWLTWFLPRLTLSIAVCQLPLLSQRLTVSQSVSLGVEPHLGLITRYLLLFDNYGLVFVGRPLWREDGSVFYICCWPSPA
jgi:hypothetical protein